MSATAEHFGNKKMFFFCVMRPSDQGYLAFIELLYSILEAWKCQLRYNLDFGPVVKVLGITVKTETVKVVVTSG